MGDDCRFQPLIFQGRSCPMGTLSQLARRFNKKQIALSPEVQPPFSIGRFTSFTIFQVRVCHPKNQFHRVEMVVWWLTSRGHCYNLRQKLPYFKECDKVGPKSLS